jgi:hypothetical protein
LRGETQYQVLIEPPDTWCALIATANNEGSAMVVENPTAKAKIYTVSEETHKELSRQAYFQLIHWLQIK